MKILIAFFLLLSSCSDLRDVSLNGHWEGTISSSGRSINIIFDVSDSKFLYEIPELGLFGEKVDKLKIDGNTFILEIQGREIIRVEGTEKKGKITAEIEGFDGISILMEKTSDNPHFYAEEELDFFSNGARLSGTLIKPLSEEPYPVIIYVHGSGKMTRETMKNWAFMLVKTGAAGFIFDRRGKGRSEGDTSRILPISVMTEDVIAAADLLKGRNDIDSTRIGLFGLSQGGWVAPNAVSVSDNFAFLITVSAPGITPDEQNEYVIDKMIEKYVDNATGNIKWRGFSEKDTIKEMQLLNQNHNDSDDTETVPGFSNFDPLPVWSRIKIPVLALWGEDDRIVPSKLSEKKIEGALTTAGNNKYELKIFPGGNHVLKLDSKADKFAGKWDVSVPGSLAYITDWVKKNVMRKP